MAIGALQDWPPPSAAADSHQTGCIWVVWFLPHRAFTCHASFTPHRTTNAAPTPRSSAIPGAPGNILPALPLASQTQPRRAEPLGDVARARLSTQELQKPTSPLPSSHALGLLGTSVASGHRILPPRPSLRRVSPPPGHVQQPPRQSDQAEPCVSLGLDASDAARLRQRRGSAPCRRHRPPRQQRRRRQAALAAARTASGGCSGCSGCSGRSGVARPPMRRRAAGRPGPRAWRTLNPLYPKFGAPPHTHTVAVVSSSAAAVP
jgi:hypothetical protein